MNKLKERIKKYEFVSTNLASLSDEHLRDILAEATPLHTGIGGKSVLIYRNDIPVFVKKIPLTAIEQLPQNIKSTSNIFNLPLFYQYGVGSAGFGVWRELATHIITTNWVVLAKCINFPIMYHWRILPNTPNDLNIDYWGNVNNYTQYWENSEVIRERLENINNSTSHIAVFLEYVPQSLEQWLNHEIKQGASSAEHAIKFVDDSLRITNNYMKTHGLLHFDAHFRNILTDGETIFLTDFGLALSEEFELSPAEVEFLKEHRNYDEACAAVNLLHCIITSIFGKDHWELKLRQLIENQSNELTPGLTKLISSYGLIALTMDNFFQKLQKESKFTPYPTSLINDLLKKIKSDGN